ncbi:Dyp-type peroxidase [Marinomonas transparens]|uniref:Dyp-type peroxidase n=1 Tax=Marinomonas transparens TaxID=2795388 RepID=A0A934MX24_9GAMM|nr:Dyp-type peroxidase [Marinomonas transparens]MBJ7538839.1 Dyp-type peroxidase [Marinomonas transparens]
MVAFQSGIIAEASSDALFITFNVNLSQIDKVKAALATYPERVIQFQQQFPNADPHAVVGISSQLWDHLDHKRPIHLTTFPHIKGAEFEVKPTDVDLVLHIRSSRRDVTYQLSNALYDTLKSSVSLVEEISCFQYLDNRDLTGFVDGTENPEGDNRKNVALVGNEDTNFQDGSYFNLMRFIHDLNKWEAEDLKTQEDTYGRTKYANEEYPATEKSAHAHTKRTSLKDENGQSMEILRHSMPYASMTEKGLMFASYSKTPVIFNLMLESMIKGDQDGNTDHIMKYTRAKTGQAFFAPSNHWLTSLAQ